MKPDTKTLSKKYDVLAPDGSEIRLMTKLESASSVHCRLPGGKVSKATRHKTVSEIWFVLSGSGEIWRRDMNGVESIAKLSKNTSITIPVGTHFQFRNPGKKPLDIILVTIPPWPGNKEAVFIPGKWDPKL